MGRAFIVGDHVDTDLIIPAHYLNTIDPAALAAHCLEPVDPEFPRKAKPGDVLVAGANFGCGSSREHAPIAIKGCGLAAVVARSFARIFFRNAINIGLPILECPEMVDITEEGDEVTVDLARGEVTNVTKGRSFRAEPFPEFMLEIVRAGGLVDYTRARLA
jgi:3-isopropylmalate/(R)-2-methylmalate dehydratase small subunit